MINFADPKIREQIFTTEQKNCGWLISFINDQLKMATTETMKDYWVKELQKATEWKYRLNQQGKIVNPVKDWNKEETIK